MLYFSPTIDAIAGELPCEVNEKMGLKYSKRNCNQQTSTP